MNKLGKYVLLGMGLIYVVGVVVCWDVAGSQVALLWPIAALVLLAPYFK